MKQLLLICNLILFSISSYAGEAFLNQDGLELSVTFEDASIPKGNNNNSLYGTLKILNTADVEKLYSNKNLILIVNGDKSRTYVDTIATAMVDIGDIQLQPNKDLNLKTYWVFNKPIFTKNSKSVLQWLK